MYCDNDVMYIQDWVLIDTWWNVNKILAIKSHKILTCFNRYMVECEFQVKGETWITNICFNRYMVECEFLNH